MRRGVGVPAWPAMYVPILLACAPHTRHHGRVRRGWSSALLAGSSLVMAACTGGTQKSSAPSSTYTIATPTSTTAAVLATPALSPSTSAPPRFGTRCSASQLRLQRGDDVSPATGQNPLSLTLTNVASTGC